MQPTRALVVVAALTFLTACSSDDAVSHQPSTSASASTAPTVDAPSPENTYVAAPGDPRSHDVEVTIRDKGRSYSPGSCTAINGGADGGGSDDQDVLAFSGPDQSFESRPLGDDVPIPQQGTPRPDGTCEATLTVTLPYAPRYHVGIAVAGHGIADPSRPAPEGADIVTQGSAQDVVVVNYPS